MNKTLTMVVAVILVAIGVFFGVSNGDNIVYTSLGGSAPTTPTNLTVDGSTYFNGSYSGTVDLQCSGSTDAESDDITYIINVSSYVVIDSCVQAEPNVSTCDGSDEGSTLDGPYGTDDYTNAIDGDWDTYEEVDMNTTSWAEVSFIQKYYFPSDFNAANSVWTIRTSQYGYQNFTGFDDVENVGEEVDSTDCVLTDENGTYIAFWSDIGGNTDSGDEYAGQYVSYACMVSEAYYDEEWEEYVDASYVTFFFESSWDEDAIDKVINVYESGVYFSTLSISVLGNHSDGDSYDWDLSTEEVGHTYYNFSCTAIDLDGSNTNSSSYDITSIFKIRQTLDYLHLSSTFVNETIFSTSWGEVWAFVSELATNVTYSIDDGSNQSMSRYDNDWDSDANSLRSEYAYNDYSYAPLTNEVYFTSPDVFGDYDEYGSCILDKDKLYCPSKLYGGWAEGFHNFYILNASTGEVLWTFNMQSSSDATPQIDTSDDDVVWINTINQGDDTSDAGILSYFYKLNVSSHTQLCNYTVSNSNLGGFPGGFAQDENHVFDCGHYENVCYSINKADCSLNWSVNHTTATTHSVSNQPLVYEDYLIVAFNEENSGAWNGNYHALNISDGSIEKTFGDDETDSWDSQARIYPGTDELWLPVRYNYTAYDASEDFGGLIVYNFTSGEHIETFFHEAYTLAKPTFYDGLVFDVSMDTDDHPSVYVINHTNMNISCTYESDSEWYEAYQGPVCSNGICYLTSTSDDSTVEAFNPYTCEQVWSYRGGGSFAQPLLSDGLLYVKQDGGGLLAFGEEKRPTWYANMTGTNGTHNATVWVTDGTKVNSTTYEFSLTVESSSSCDFSTSCGPVDCSEGCTISSLGVCSGSDTLIFNNNGITTLNTFLDIDNALFTGTCAINGTGGFA